MSRNVNDAVSKLASIHIRSAHTQSTNVIRGNLLGAPGAGKGTHSKRILLKYPAISFLSSGDLLRDNMLRKTKLGLRAKDIIAKGELVDDSTMIGLVTSEMQDRGFLKRSFFLDGFPRTVKQAEELDYFLKDLNCPLNYIINLDVPHKVILDRIINRWVHAPSGRTYNLTYNPPKVDGIDDITAEKLTKRPDDDELTFRTRLRKYEQVTGPLADYYGKKGILKTFKGETSDVIWPQIENSLEDWFSLLSHMILIGQPGVPHFALIPFEYVSRQALQTPIFMNSPQGRAAFKQFQSAIQKVRGSGGSAGGAAPKGAFAGIGGLLILGGGALAVNNAIFNVDGGHRAIKYTRTGGVKTEIYPEGTHFLVPWFETAIDYDVRAKPRNIASLTGTKDLQMVNITCRVLSRPNIQELPTIYRTLGEDYDERVLPSIVNEVLKAVVAQFNASQLITQREKVARLVRDNLAKRAARFNILLDDVSLTHVQFSPEFTAAVESKQVAQQEAQRAAFIVDRARQEKQGKIVTAQGEARSAELIGDALKNKPQYIELRRLETAREIAHLMAAGGNKVLLDADTLLLNVAQLDYRKEPQQRK